MIRLYYDTKSYGPKRTINFSNEDALFLARKKVLPPGYKPEDYFVCGDAQFCRRIAEAVTEEYQHITGMVARYGDSAAKKFQNELMNNAE